MQAVEAGSLCSGPARVGFPFWGTVIVTPVTVTKQSLAFCISESLTKGFLSLRKASYLLSFESYIF